MRRTALLAAAVALAGCGSGGGGDAKPAAKATASPEQTAQATPSPDPNEQVRWPRYWATRDQAETGADANLETTFFAGYDDRAVVYNGQDVVRVLKRGTGRPIGRVVLASGRYVCANPPRREIGNGIAVFGTGDLASSESTCDQVIGVSTKTGHKRWTYGERGRNVEEPHIDVRDGKVLYAEDKLVTVLDARTGKRRWRRSAVQIQGSRTAKDDFCRLGTALAADAPVVIVYAESCGNPFNASKITGLDLATGKRLWTARDPRDPDQFNPYFVQPNPLDGRYLGAILDGDHRRRAGEAAFVDSKTGRTAQYATPNPMRYGDTDSQYEQCSDFSDESGLSYDGVTCAFVVGARVLYVQPSLTRKKSGVTIVAANLVSGKREWTFQRRPKRDESGNGQIEVLGFNAARTEFWIGEDKASLLRIDVATGKIIARARPAPPLDLPQFTIAGPEFWLVRGTGGITNVKSGLDFYRTDAR